MPNNILEFVASLIAVGVAAGTARVVKALASVLREWVRERYRLKRAKLRARTLRRLAPHGSPINPLDALAAIDPGLGTAPVPARRHSLGASARRVQTSRREDREGVTSAENRRLRGQAVE